MKTFLLKKIDILCKGANGRELFSLKDTYTNMLSNPSNLWVVKEGMACIERVICARVSKETHHDFYKELDAVNYKISACEKSCLVGGF